MSTSERTPSGDAMPTTRGLNFYRADPNLAQVCRLVLDPATFERAQPHLDAMGAVAGGELDALAAEADRNPPELRQFDARGERIDAVVEHPSYTAMERLAFSRFGLAAMSHRGGVLGWDAPVPHVVKYALSYLFAQSEFGLLCPVSVTDSTSRMLRHYGSEELKRIYLDRLTSTDFDEMWQGTQWMTEKTGGSDVGASTTIARRDADGSWRLWGDKWFCSNAKADVAVTLARPEGAPSGTRGLGMFLVPKMRPDGSRNAFTLNRLKDKFGSRSMATAEVSYCGAMAYVVGDLERGFRQMMEMVNVSRLSNAMRAAGIMRRCLLESVVHARARAAFGRPLIGFPLLRANLLEMLLDSEAALSVVLNSAAVLDRWDNGDSTARPLFRVLTPLAKFWITLRARVVAGEAMTIRGGNGYIEEWVNARLLRDSHLGAIWEGASNVVALDVQRALLREDCAPALFAFITEKLAAVSVPEAAPDVESLRRALAALTGALHSLQDQAADERDLAARVLAEALYHVLASTLLVSEGDALQRQNGDSRKLGVASLYVQRWLTPSKFGQPYFTVAQLAQGDAILAGSVSSSDA